MDLTYPHADGLDSNCHVVTGGDGDVPTAVAPRCKEPAATWFTMPDGTRIYVCREHSLEPFRFPVADPDDLPEDYQDLRSVAAEEGISLQNPSREDLIERLLSPPDPATFEENPHVVRCSSCGKLTLVEDIHTVEGSCPACRDELPELDPSDYAVTTPVEE